jgi:hypothetical protein
MERNGLDLLNLNMINPNMTIKPKDARKTAKGKLDLLPMKKSTDDETNAAISIAEEKILKLRMLFA